MSSEIDKYNSILIELNKAVKMHNFYPAGHPNLDVALDNCFAMIKRAADERGEVHWRVDQKGFYSDQNPLAAGNKDIAALARKAFYRKVHEVTFTPRITTGDLKSFLEVFRLEPEAVKARGGVESIFAELDVEGILLNEMSYENLKKLKKELEENREEEKVIQAEQAEDEARGETDKSRAQEEKSREEEKKPETLAELLGRLRDERDFLRYNDLSVRIKEKTDLLVAEKRFDPVFSAMSLFEEHASSAGLDPDLRELARERLMDYLSPEVLRYLVIRAGRKDEGSRKEVQRVLLHGGDRAIEMVIDSLVEAPEASTRRNLFNTLILFGDVIKPYVTKRLESPRWYEVRQMVALIGELRDPETVAQLEKAYGHEDLRVKKEVLKSLVKIPSDKSREMLVKALDEQDASLKCQAIISIGVSRDVNLVHHIGDLALKKDPFGDNIEVRREAIKALGLIGHESTVDYLSKILFKKTWFGKKANEELRTLAVASLGQVGSDTAIGAIEKACESSEGEVHMACKRILEGREKTT